ncbi:hypothetical protein QAD02_012077 [Eretmocerus hayati]|uniref:Uncharacterized protein n=1 Tax=Eretmocerus hayati TaxID=131215 RepID=A0ACC2P3D2_9HYME|nr:hypothetical protein QAD02_012077 [Eretmocerus hayati]
MWCFSREFSRLSPYWRLAIQWLLSLKTNQHVKRCTDKLPIIKLLFDMITNIFESGVPVEVLEFPSRNVRTRSDVKCDEKKITDKTKECSGLFDDQEVTKSESDGCGSNTSGITHEFQKLAGLESFLNNDKYSDVKIHTRYQVIHAHRIILSSGNDFFAGLLHEDSVDSIHCEDFEYEVMMDVIRFIYIGKVYDLETKAKELFVAADKYKVRNLKAKCEKYLCKTVNAENVSELINFAEYYNAHSLKKEATSFLRGKTNRFSIMQSFKLG